MNENRIIIFTDGACLGNPGPGGWAALLRYGSHEKELFGNTTETTNNRMELIAAIEGIKAVKKNLPIDLYTDSKYVKDGVTQWLEGWKANNWANAKKKKIKNLDLWQELDTTIEQHDIMWHWVKGHSGHPENERVDSLAQNAARELQKLP